MRIVRAVNNLASPREAQLKNAEVSQNRQV
jgi:hypothetical protein